ncbi:zinc finger protein CONSTANS-LIKE 2-like [Canna indica]|uniref:Zinc finger protein CONSTANS-LIKE 2-like n=1 Tax=Canna indica TaxID=4628 RepID=A0AAQ3JVL6_9LILI|nr:zinc finger protein CONSTANS-LIKE 2-like [Canna indica]
MFHSFCSSSSYNDGTFLPPIFSATTPQAFLSDANVCLPPFPSSFPPNASSPASCYLHRSSSTHSLPLHHHIPDTLNAPPRPQPLPQLSSSPTSSCDYLDFNAVPMRRVLSTGDLQGMNALHENYIQEGGAIAGRVGRYTAEERKERIERYRSKRNQRNFHKKITYACRKTLADSRPRVRGRFARNGETETEVEMEAETAAAINFDGFSYYSYEQNASFNTGEVDNGGDLWSHFQAALATDDDGDCRYEEDILASYVGDFSMNILS